MQPSRKKYKSTCVSCGQGDHVVNMKFGYCKPCYEDKFSCEWCGKITPQLTMVLSICLQCYLEDKYEVEYD